MANGKAKWSLRRYAVRDRAAVLNLLKIINILYPRGGDWLDRRLDDVLHCRARCVLAIFGDTPVGVTIESPKGTHRVKLSTFYVHPGFRNVGIGSALLANARRNWLADDIDTVHVTTDVKRMFKIEPILLHYGFSFESICSERYGPDRHEAIYRWSKDAAENRTAVYPSHFRRSYIPGTQALRIPASERQALSA